MTRRLKLTAAMLCLALASCTDNPKVTRIELQDPAGPVGASLPARKYDFGALTLALTDSDPLKNFGIQLAGGARVAGGTLGGKLSLHLMGNAPDQPKVQANYSSSGSIEYLEWHGSKYITVDDNADGQPDIRAFSGAGSPEAWIDDKWQAYSTESAGDQTRYYIGTGEVFRTSDGWSWAPPKR
jgi:hypothetical protein